MPKQFLIKNATVIQEGHPRHLKRSDILISNGRIEKIAAKLSTDAKLIEGSDLVVSAGYHDMRVHLADPGYEHKENLNQMCQSAAAGGFTSVSTLPDSLPVVDHKSGLQYILNSSKDQLVDVKPYGTLSERMKGEHLAEMFDMHSNGASAFTDGDLSVSSGLLKKALLYVQPFGGLLISNPMDKALHHEGMVNESEDTVHTGLKVSPSIAEYSCVKQQLDILRYTGGKLHLSGISCKESVDLIRAAKAENLNVTADVCILNLCLTDKETLSFDSNYKLFPLLRTEADRSALIEGVRSGTIDAIVSNHHAQNVELKKVEFDYADFGALSLQLMPSFYEMYLKDELDHATFVKSISSKPREILRLEPVNLKEGDAAVLTVVDRAAKWTLNHKSNKTASQNTHLWNKELQGQVKAIFNGSKVKTYS